MLNTHVLYDGLNNQVRVLHSAIHIHRCIQTLESAFHEGSLFGFIVLELLFSDTGEIFGDARLCVLEHILTQVNQRDIVT